METTPALRPPGFNVDPNQPNPLAPPMMPPGPSPALGFQIWAGNPENAMKVQPSMTSPSAPLQPNAGMASAQPPQQQSALTPPNLNLGPGQAPNVTPSPVIPAPQSMEQDVKNNPNDYAHKIASGKVGNILNMIAATSLGAAGGMHGNPGAGAEYALGVLKHDEGVEGQNQDTYNNRWVAPQQNSLKMQDMQAQMAQRQAAADKSNAQSDSYAPITLSPEQAAAIGHPELAGEQMHPKTFSAMLTGGQKADSAEAIQGGKNKTAKQISDDRNARIQATQDAANKTKLLLQDKKDQTSTQNTNARVAGAAANTNARLAAKGAGAPGGGKVPADVTKRAALASNVLENADAVQEIVKRRPDIVGAGGGRYTNVQQMIGSDDPDISALGTRMHNIALASNGAHGLRSAEAIAQTENELFNHYKTGPNGIVGGLNAVRGSVQTFLDDEKNFQNSGSRTGKPSNPLTPPAQNGKPSGKKDSLGIL